MKGMKQWLVALVLGVMASAVWADISLVTVAEVEKVTVDEKGVESVSYVPADLVVPGDVVRYTVTATNSGNQAADNIVVTNPVPAAMEYLSGSAQSNALGSGTTIEYSVDAGKSWGALETLVVTTEDGAKRPAAAQDVNAVRWKLNFSLEAGKAAKVWYKARLK